MKLVFVFAIACFSAASAAPRQAYQDPDWPSIKKLVADFRTYVPVKLEEVKDIAFEDSPTEIFPIIEYTIDFSIPVVLSYFDKVELHLVVGQEDLTAGLARDYFEDLDDVILGIQLGLQIDLYQLSPGAQLAAKAVFTSIHVESKDFSEKLYPKLP